MLRDALEAVLSPRVAAAVLFEGLAAWGERVPVDAEEYRSAIEGPLRRALDSRLSAEQVDRVVTRLLALFTAAEATTDVHGAVRAATQPSIEIELDFEDADADAPTRPRVGAPFADEPSTLALPGRKAGPVPVLVLAASRGFASRLRLAVGADRVAPTPVREVHGLAGVASAASVIVVDATDVPPVDPETLVGSLGVLPAGCVPAVYGSDLPFGRRVSDAFVASGVQPVDVAQSEGIEPLFDLVRSRA